MRNCDANRIPARRVAALVDGSVDCVNFRAERSRRLRRRRLHRPESSLDGPLGLVFGVAFGGQFARKSVVKASIARMPVSMPASSRWNSGEWLNGTVDGSFSRGVMPTQK